MNNPIQLSDDPFRATAELLGVAILACEAELAAIELMEVSLSKWRIRAKAIELVKECQEDIKELLRQQAKMRDDLKTIGY